MNSRGLTLIEIIGGVCVAVLVALMAMVHMGGHRGRRLNTTVARLKHLEGVLQLFKGDYERYPEKFEDLVHRPSYCDSEKWPTRGYLQELPVDEWGRRFLYRVPGERGPFDLVSWGRDGKPGGDGEDTDLRSKPLR
ncbi:MAG TPA: type II secretion system protein GspG [Planctomycetota bacterium]|nr:type II secretion system protein GspG [Planctomycetota bacterium]